ncbi:MAG: hypothetical protein PHP51_01495 [Desulfotomaculaceae bacterium]|nr:hypothetical protein [Desulfotomaculaceae bacterium]MDD4767231.1 hypothetical protein [Desulfotomaculaceae bacterium]
MNDTFAFRLKQRRMAAIVSTALLLSFSFFLLGTFSSSAAVISDANFISFLNCLNPLYWIGLALVIATLVALWYFDSYNTAALSLPAVMLLGIMLLSIPVLLQENAPFYVSYYPAGEVQTILQSHHINMQSELPLITYHYWPGLHLFSAVNILVSGVSLDFLLKYIPLLWVIIFTLETYVIAKNLNFSLRQWLLAAWLILVAQWIGQYYYGAQAIAMLMYLIVLSVIFSNKITVRHSLIFFVTIISLIITHSLTAFSAVLSIIFVAVFRKRVRTMALASFVLFMFYYSYISLHVFNIGVHEFVGKLLQFDFNTFWESSDFSNSAASSLSKVICHYAKMIFPASFLLMMLTTIFYFIKEHKKLSKEKIIYFYCSIMWLIGVGILIMYKYGTEMHYRIYLYATVIIVFLFISRFSRSPAVVALVVLLTVLFFPARYGTYSYEQTLESELKGSKFLAGIVDPSVSFAYQFPSYVWYHEPVNIYTPLLLYAPQFGEDNLKVDPGSVTFIADSIQSHNYMEYAYGFDKIAGWISQNPDQVNAIYSNGSYWAYKNRSS